MISADQAAWLTKLRGEGPAFRLTVEASNCKYRGLTASRIGGRLDEITPAGIAALEEWERQR